MILRNIISFTFYYYTILCLSIVMLCDVILILIFDFDWECPVPFMGCNLVNICTAPVQAVPLWAKLFLLLANSRFSQYPHQASMFTSRSIPHQISNRRWLQECNMQEGPVLQEHSLGIGLHLWQDRWRCISTCVLCFVL